MEDRNKPSIFETNLLYLFAGLLLLIVGSRVQLREIYSGLLITEYILILLPVLLFLKIRRYPINKVLRLNRISFKEIILVIGITVFTYPIAVFFQSIFVLLLSQFKEMTPTVVPMPYDGFQYLISFFVIAISPGICEEIMFRGIIMDAYERLGRKKSVIISALLFGMFHFTLLNFVGPAILGFVFGLMVYKSNSIYAGIIGHTVNNGIALTIGYFINKYQHQIDSIISDSPMTLETTSVIRQTLVPFLFLILCFYMVKLMLRSLGPLEAKDHEVELQEALYFEGLSDDDYKMEHIYDYQELPHRPENLNSLKYLPLLTVFIIFILINWLNHFL